MQNNKMRRLILVMLGLGLSACGGSSGDDEGSYTGSTPPPTTGSQRWLEGTIQAVSEDTLTLNGVTVKLAGVQPSYADTPWTEPLQVGMDVSVLMAGDHAEQIELNPLLTGMVEVARSASWQVNGVPVHYEGEAPTAGSSAMVFGRYGQDGSVTASHTEPLVALPVWIEVENRVANLDESSSTFTLGTLTVNYNGAQLEEGNLAEGSWVEVYGQLTGDRLVASLIEVEDEANWPDASELQGYVHYFTPANGLLELDRQRQVWVTQTTRFDGGTVADLQPGRLIEVEVINGNQAAEIDFADRDDAGSVQSGRQFLLAGLADWHDDRLTINGIAFTIDSMTRFEDGLNRDNLDGRWVELEGVDQSGLNLVREIEPDVQDGTLELTGQVNGGALWGYYASDDSLASWEGKWSELDCSFDGNWLSNCRRDD